MLFLSLFLFHSRMSHWLNLQMKMNKHWNRARKNFTFGRFLKGNNIFFDFLFSNVFFSFSFRSWRVRITVKDMRWKHPLLFSHSPFSILYSLNGKMGMMREKKDWECCNQLAESCEDRKSNSRNSFTHPFSLSLSLYLIRSYSVAVFFCSFF